MRKLIAIVSIVAVVCLGLAIVSVLGDSTNVETLRQHSARPTPGPGWLILNGRLIDPPYEVTRRGDTILVNNMQVLPKHQPIKLETKRPRESARSMATLSREFGENYAGWVEKYGRDSAGLLAQDFYRSSAIVDTAYLVNAKRLNVTYSDWPGHEVWIDLSPKYMDTPPEGWVLASIEKYRKRIESALNHKALVIFQNGQSRIIPYPRSETRFNELKRISTTISDPAERAKLIIPLVADSKMADSIAINFRDSTEK